jgi:predicted RNA binding protein YcfA (HicA-like mRNA interferase family)
MSKKEKAIAKLSKNPRSIRFEEADAVLCELGCLKRTKGSHATYSYPKMRPITIPYRKPFILPVYVKLILQLIDQIEDNDDI